MNWYDWIKETGEPYPMPSRNYGKHCVYDEKSGRWYCMGYIPTEKETQHVTGQTNENNTNDNEKPKYDNEYSCIYKGIVVHVVWNKDELKVIYPVSKSYSYNYVFSAIESNKYKYKMKTKHMFPGYYGTTVVPRYTEYDIELLDYISSIMLNKFGIILEYPHEPETSNVPTDTYPKRYHEKLHVSDFLVEIDILETAKKLKIMYGYPKSVTYCGNGWCKTTEIIDTAKEKRDFIFELNNNIAILRTARSTIGRELSPITALNNTDIMILNEAEKPLNEKYGITLDYSTFEHKPVTEPEKKDNTILWLFVGIVVLFLLIKGR